MQFSLKGIKIHFLCRLIGKDSLTLTLLVANFAITKLCKNPEKRLKPWQMGTHLKVLSEGYPMNTNKTGFRCFSEYLWVFVLKKLDVSSLSIGRVNFSVNNFVLLALL